jgi:hypothetical protein
MPTFPSLIFTPVPVLTIGGHRHRPWCRRYPTSDITISYSDIETKNLGLNPFIPISEWFRYRHQLPFWYRTKSILDISISKLYNLLSNDPSKLIWYIIVLSGFEPSTFMVIIRQLAPLLRGFTTAMSDIGCGTKVYYDIRNNVGLWALQSDIADHGYRTERPPMVLTYPNVQQAQVY